MLEERETDGVLEMLQYSQLQVLFFFFFFFQRSHIFGDRRSYYFQGSRIFGDRRSYYFQGSHIFGCQLKL